MPALDTATWTAICAEARRAPSPHNTQPARWHCDGDVVELREDPSRRLPAADPTGRDHRMALGAAWQGTRLALGARGYTLVDVAPAYAPDANGTFMRGVVDGGGARDPLVDVVGRRATWRGVFEPIDNVTLTKLRTAMAALAARVSTDRMDIDDAAARIDPASVHALRRAGYLEELVQWSRFSRDHPQAQRDGLNLDMLRLSTTEGMLTRALLRRDAFDTAATLGMADMLVSESKQCASASALVAVTAPKDELDFPAGQRLYRAWLAVASCGVHLCPMSVLSDDDATRAHFERALGVPTDARLVQLWRVGRAPHGVPLSPRLPVAELML